MCSVREMPINLALLYGLSNCNFKGRVAVTANGTTDAEQLQQAGADLVLMPYSDAATNTSEKLFSVI